MSSRRTLIFVGEAVGGFVASFFLPLFVRVVLAQIFFSGSGEGSGLASYLVFGFIFSFLPVLIYLPIITIAVIAAVNRRFGIILGIVGAFTLTNLLDSQNDSSSRKTFEAIRAIDLNPVQAHNLVVFDGGSNVSNAECLRFLQMSENNSLAHRYHDYKWQLNEWRIYTYPRENICQPGSRTVPEYLGAGEFRYNLCERKVDHLDTSNAIIYTEQWSSKAPIDVNFLPRGFSGRYTTITEMTASQSRLMHVTLNGSMHDFYSSLLGIYRTGFKDEQIHIGMGSTSPAKRTCRAAAGPSAHPD